MFSFFHIEGLVAKQAIASVPLESIGSMWAKNQINFENPQDFKNYPPFTRIPTLAALSYLSGFERLSL